MADPSIPTRIVDPRPRGEVAVPSPAVCVQCTVAGNEALASAGRRGKKAAPKSPDPEPIPEKTPDPLAEGAD